MRIIYAVGLSRFATNSLLTVLSICVAIGVVPLRCNESSKKGSPSSIASLGKERKGEDTDAKIAGIAILQRAEKNSIDPLSKEDAFPHLIAQTYRPKDPIKLIKTLNA